MLKTLRFKKISRSTILGILLYSTIIIVLVDVAFSVRTIHDSIIAAVTGVWLIYCIICDFKQDKQSTSAHLKTVFTSARWLYIAIASYVLYDIITMLYTRDLYYYVQQKLPYQLEFITITAAAIYHCKTKKRVAGISLAIFIAGLSVAIGSYIYYFSSVAPIYFKRLSTARDYNVFSCLLFFAMLFAFDWFNHSRSLFEAFGSQGKRSRYLRFAGFVLTMIAIMPSFYLAGSRRMVIMLPYFAIYAVVFTVTRATRTSPDRFSRWKTVAMVGVFIVAYLVSTSLLASFTDFANHKEKAYRTLVEQSKNDPETDTPKRPISSSGETTIGEMLETIEDKSMTSKRSLIYSVAFRELKTYSPTDWIFGRGAAYDLYMYYTTDDAELLNAYSITDSNQRTKSWLSAHNFMLSDLLGGGIIKLLLGMFVVFQLIRHVALAIRRNIDLAVPLGVATALVLANNFISGSYGMLNDIFFHIVLIVVFTTLFTSDTIFSRQTLFEE